MVVKLVEVAKKLIKISATEEKYPRLARSKKKLIATGATEEKLTAIEKKVWRKMFQKNLKKLLKCVKV